MLRSIIKKAISLIVSLTLVFLIFGCSAQPSQIVDNPNLENVGNSSDNKQDSVVLNRAQKTRGFVLKEGVDYTVKDKTYDEVCSEISGIFDSMKSSYFNTVYVSLLSDKKALFKSSVIEYAADFEEDITKFIYETALEKGFYIYFIFDINQYSTVDPFEKGFEYINIIGNLVNTYGYLSGILYSDFGYSFEANAAAGFITGGNSFGYDNYRYSVMTDYISNVILATKQFSSKIFAGVMYDGNSAVNETRLHFKDYCHITSWLKNSNVDFATITYDSSANQESFFDLWLNTAEPTDNQKYVLIDSSDKKFFEGFSTAVKTGFDGIIVSNTKALLSNQDVWGKIKELDNSVFSGVSENERNTVLKIFDPEKDVTSTDEKFYIISGASDPSQPVFINDVQIETDGKGYFSHRVDLNSGNNIFVIKHKEFTKEITIKYSFQIIRSVSPTNSIYVNGNSKLSVSAICLSGANVTATLNAQSITLSPASQSSNGESAFSTYTGTFVMPDATEKSQNLGKITFTATYGGQKASRTGSSVYVNKLSGLTPEIDKDFNYSNQSGKVGYIARIEREQAETFNGNTTDNRSRSINAYLPKGTLDYCDSGDSILQESDAKYFYRLLNYGKRVYSRTESYRGVKNDYISIFYGSLPDYNSMSVADISNNGRHTYITLNSEWKAPFNVTLAPQEYVGVNKIPAEYEVDSTTYEYIDFSFSYCTNVSGSFDLKNDPVFSSAEWIKKTNGEYTLRLHLKRKGMFYGWSASYNANGQLVLGFLNPAKLTPASNTYGYTLENMVIMIDPGHGGPGDSGATGFATNKDQYECALNLVIALKVKNILEDLGATVIMTRTSNVNVTLDVRNSLARQYKPDIFISFHRNGSTNPNSYGYSAYYYQPFSMQLAKEIATRCTAIRNSGKKLLNYSPPMQVCRISECPSILTENWYVTNRDDFNLIITDDFNNKNAEATVQGIIAYFEYIQ